MTKSSCPAKLTIGLVPGIYYYVTLHGEKHMEKPFTFNFHWLSVHRGQLLNVCRWILCSYGRYSCGCTWAYMFQGNYFLMMLQEKKNFYSKIFLSTINRTWARFCQDLQSTWLGMA